ncbi:hypothetical protein LIER_38873 [Lithospermum erythrorhizon]|uniref:Uncharacterized protein n=1 Tax=Lithospermum erythrorhizon TaxID=34254 RepID=A0AAV3Q7C2_LITER
MEIQSETQSFSDVFHIHELPSNGVSLDEKSDIQVHDLDSKGSAIGDCCFSGGMQGPGGMNLHLGKWCKGSKSVSSSVGSQGLISNPGYVIDVRADGRWGQSSLNSTSTGNINDSKLLKRCKYDQSKEFTVTTSNRMLRAGH